MTRDADWLVPLVRRAAPAVRLVCFPHAGGHAVVFASWVRWLPPSVEVWAAQLPGRGTRLHEPPPTSMDVVAGALVDALLAMSGPPIALFGHSVGAWVGHAVAARLAARGVTPYHLFVSACPAPDPAVHSPVRSTLADDALLDRLTALGGTPPELLEHEELMSLVLPRLRADLQIAETYTPAAEPLPCDVTALGGVRDPGVTLVDLDSWRTRARGRFTLRQFDGGHFYLFERESEVCSAILANLAALDLDGWP